LLGLPVPVFLGLGAWWKNLPRPTLPGLVKRQWLDAFAFQWHNPHTLALAAALLSVLRLEVELAKVSFQPLPELHVADRPLARVVDVSAVVLVDRLLAGLGAVVVGQLRVMQPAHDRVGAATVLLGQLPNGQWLVLLFAPAVAHEPGGTCQQPIDDLGHLL